MKRVSVINAVLAGVVLSLVAMTWRSLQPPRSDDDPKKPEQAEKTIGGSPDIDTRSTAHTNRLLEKRSPGGNRVSNRSSQSTKSEISWESEADRSSGPRFGRPITENRAARIPIASDGAGGAGASRGYERLIEEFRTARSRLRSG